MKRTLGMLLVGFVLMAYAGVVMAQTSTATIRGKVMNDRGDALANAEINAVGTQSGFVKTVNSRGDGAYSLVGLTPGEYQIVVAAPGYEPRNETVTVLIGQSLEMNLRMTPTAVLSESITVVGNQAVETKTSEAATNVTTRQIENLPQDDRNFLNFAALAPGIRVSTDPLRKTISGDAQGAEQTNMFIDGVSFKNDMLLGGIAGQDSSRGNPFPQNAVQEFRVITQNYSAQYEKASSAIISAVTKSGGNQIAGQAFVFYQPKSWVAAPPSQFGLGGSAGATNALNASYKRYQPGISVGGPIIKDKLHYFVSYEGDQEHATKLVNVNSQAFASQFSSYIGNFAAPFRSNLGFGKLSWQPLANQLLDLSGTYRKEYEIRDFGGATSYQAASKVNNYVYDGTARHQWNNSSALNQASLTWQKYNWNPNPLNPALVGQDYQGAIVIGGKDTTQNFSQRRIELRDDYNFAPWNLQGVHNFQIGGNGDFMKYNIDKRLNGNPLFSYRIDPANGLTFDQPFQARFGFGNSLLSQSNREYGIYGQDNWVVNPHLNLNLGVRWDYESNMLDNNFVLPADIVAGLSGKIDSSYLSNNRKPIKDEFQPRVGFTYDLSGDSKSVIFGGAGRYYDRLYLNSAMEERFRIQYKTYTIQFSPTGAPRADGTPTIKWDPKYMSAAGLNDLIASSSLIKPEIWLLSNNTKPPYSNQANLGVRQALGTWLGSLSYNIVRGYHGPTWVFATGSCCIAPVPGFGNVIISDPAGGKRYWYNAWYLSLDRPYTNNWGVHVAYTHAKALQNGGRGGSDDCCSFDLPNSALFPRRPVTGSEPNHLVASGIFGLPFGFKFSTTATLGTGAADVVIDVSQGFDLAGHLKTGVFNRAIYPPKTWGFGYRNLDLSLEKDFPTFGRTSVGVVGQVFNAGNFKNYGCLSDFLGPDTNPNTIGIPGCVVSLGRREQIGLKVNF
jgi:carboxypeptidase family protein/TonB-dependent receptor-like protein